MCKEKVHLRMVITISFSPHRLNFHFTLILIYISCRFVFTADPRGKLKLWRLLEAFPSDSHCPVRICDVSLVAEFVSSFTKRIMCLDASLEEEVYFVLSLLYIAESI